MSNEIRNMSNENIDISETKITKTILKKEKKTLENLWNPPSLMCHQIWPKANGKAPEVIKSK